MRLALEGGYEAVQMREVAERADVSLATIYRHFPGKDVLLVAGLGEWVRIVRRRIEGLELGANPAERLATALEHASASTDAAPVLMGALITALATTDPAAGEYKLVVESEIQAIVRHALGGHPSLDAEGITRVIGHVWHSALVRWVGGMAPDGSVGRELAHAARLLVGPRTPDPVGMPDGDDRAR